MNVPPTRTRAAVVAGLGAVLLRRSLAADSAGPRFYLAGSALAATWLVGAGWSRPESTQAPPRVGGVSSQVAAVARGVAAFGVFWAGARVTRRVPFARATIAEVMRHERVGSSRAVLALALATGAAEECFFRGALYDLAPATPIKATTAAYTLVTCASGNPALVFASAVMGPVFASSRASGGGIRGSVLTHVAWSSLMLRYIPPMFARHDGAPRQRA